MKVLIMFLFSFLLTSCATRGLSIWEQRPEDLILFVEQHGKIKKDNIVGFISDSREVIFTTKKQKDKFYESLSLNKYLMSFDSSKKEVKPFLWRRQSSFNEFLQKKYPSSVVKTKKYKSTKISFENKASGFLFYSKLSEK